MRLLVAVATLVWASGLMAQTKVAAADETAAPHQPIRAQRFGRTAGFGTAPRGARKAPIPASAPVVTLTGVCKDPQAKAPCKTVITREELDAFAEAMAPGAPESARGRLALQYARTIVLSHLAEQKGLEKNPALAKEMAIQLLLARMRILANAYWQAVKAQTPKVSDADAQKYYDAHREQYEQAQVLRISVPLALPNANTRILDRRAVRAEMEALRARALAGEDFNVLQREAYKKLQILAEPPAVTPTSIRRNSLQGDEAKAFDLQPGDISEVLDLPAAVAIVKMESKAAPPLASVREEIENALMRNQLEEELTKATGKIGAKFNLDYLDLTSQPALFGQM